MSKTLVLVDASGYIFRAYYALPAMNRPDGTPIGAVYGFTQMLLKLMADKNPDYAIVVLDRARASFRNEIYPEYKANRDAPPPDLVPQFPLIAPAAEALNLAVASADGFEADDLIATYTKAGLTHGMQVEVISSDKDLMQLIQPGVIMFDPMKQKYIGETEVAEKFGVAPDRVVDVLALAGDSSDNVPGVPGIGVKTAATLIDEFGDLESLLVGASSIKQNKRRESLIEFADQARLSKKLVILREDAPMPVALQDASHKPYDAAVLRDFLTANNFKSLLRRIGDSDPASATPSQATAIKTDYRLLTNEDEVAAWLAQAHDNNSGLLAISSFSDNNTLLGIGLAHAPGQAAYIPVQQKTLGLDKVMPQLQPLLLDEAILKIGCDIKQTDHALAGALSAHLAPVDDVMCMAFVLDAGKGTGYGLEALVNFHLGQDMLVNLPEAAADDTTKPKTKPSLATTPPSQALPYTASRVDMILRLWQALHPRLIAEKKARVYERLERPLIPVLADMESTGIRLDAQRLAAMSDEFGGRLAALEKDIYQLAGKEFLIASPKQLGAVLFDEMKLPHGKKATKSGAWSTDVEVLETLAANDHVIADKVLAWRHLAKLKSTYADALVGFINPQTQRVHTRYSMVGATTGRLSSIDPNLQNIPTRTAEGRRIRAAFVAAAGTQLISADYSQIELRLIAHIANESSMLDAFANGVDIHAQTAAEVFGTPLTDMPAEMRRRAKAINFGIIYGISPFGLARQLHIPQAEAADYINKYLSRFAGIKRYMDRMRTTVKNQGYVETLFGRRLAIQGINTKDYARRGFAERQAINAPIQGTAADIIKQAMVRMPRLLAESDCPARMLLQVHDELIFECPTNAVEAATRLITEVMEGAASPTLTLKAPLVVEARAGQAWDEVH